MKRSSIYFILLAIAIGFVSCSKDAKGPAHEISKEYTEQNLVVTNAGEEISGGSIKIDAVNTDEVKVTITNIVNGHSTFEVLAAVIKTKSQSEYSFTGQKNVDGMSVDVEGVIVDGVATVDVEVQIANPAILKSWTYTADEFGSMKTAVFELKNKSDKVSWQGQDIPVTEFNSYATDLMDMILGIGLQEFSLTFDKNGYVGITGFSPLAPEGQQEINIPKLARYYYSPTAKTLVFDAPLGGLLPGASTIQIPFDCNIENNILTATIKKEFIAQLLPMIPTGEALDQLLGSLDGLVPPDLAPLLPMIKMLVSDMVNAVTDPDVTSLKIGARLTAATTPPVVQMDALKAKLLKQ